MKENYGFFKHFINDNHYVSLTKAVSSAHTTKATKKTMRVIHGERGHYSNLIIHNGICYVGFVHIKDSAGGDNEYRSDISLTHARFSLERAESPDFDFNKDVTLHSFGSVGDTFAGVKARSSTNSPCMLVIDDILYTTVVFSNEKEGQWSVFASAYDTRRGEYVDEYEMMLDYKGNLMPFNDDAINHIYEKEGFKVTRPGIMILISTGWSEYCGEYYATAKIDVDANNGIIVKTRDFRTVEFVAVVDGNENGQCEVASRVFDGKIYVACRQPWTTPYLVFNRYDIDEGVWMEPYKIEDGNSRPWIFEYNGGLYLFNTIEEVGSGRRFANISRIRTDKKAHNRKNAPVDVVATLFECGDHHSYFVYEGRLYFTATFRGKVHFGELKLKEYSPEKINDRLIELFGEE